MMKLISRMFLFLQTSSDGNTTVSILSLWPKMEHINLELVCRASNPLIKETDKVDSMRLEINCKLKKVSKLFHKKSAIYDVSVFY